MNTANELLSPGAVAGLRALYPPPSWVRGATAEYDAEFLLGLVTAQAPTRIVEIGVAAGVSSAVLLYALDTLPEPSSRSLYSCDVQPECYFDARRATGEIVGTMYPQPVAAWTLNTNVDTRRLAGVLSPASIDLTFIDANHAHPWPLLDLLHMTVLAKPGSWVALHDINLPAIAPAHAPWGAKLLFDEWPFEKVVGGGSRRNIGAVKLPHDFTLLRPLAHSLLDRAWEHSPTLWHVRLPDWFAEVQVQVERRIAQAA